MTFALLVLIKLAVAVMILAIGLGSRFTDIRYLWVRPRLFMRSLLAMYVAVPLVALLAVRFIPAPPAVKAAMLVLAVSAGARCYRAKWRMSAIAPISLA